MKSEIRFTEPNSSPRERIYRGLDRRHIDGYRIKELDIAAVGIRSVEEIDIIIDFLSIARVSFGPDRKQLPIRMPRLPREQNIDQLDASEAIKRLKE